MRGDFQYVKNAHGKGPTSGSSSRYISSTFGVMPKHVPPRPMQTLAKIEIDPAKTISCSTIRAMNGNLVAIPFGVQKFTSPRKAFKHISVSHADFAPKKESSCGASLKPLSKYDVNAQRNRLPQDKFKPIDRNRSQVQLGDNYPRQFVTVNRNIHRGETGIMSSNASIVANKVRFYHSLQAR